MEESKKIPDKETDIKLTQPEKNIIESPQPEENIASDNPIKNEVVSPTQESEINSDEQSRTLKSESMHSDRDLPHHDYYSYSHRDKKTLKSYLFDFFMLFLAVFCGYLAQWQLERSGENQRERQFIQSLAEDLKKDTFQLMLYIHFNENSLTYCDSLQCCIATTDIFKNSNSFYNYSRELARYIRYNPTDRTIQQLKNAGNMRLIRKWNVSNAITDYDSKTKLLSEFDQQLNGQIIKYREYLIESLDLPSYDKLNPAGSFMGNNIRTRGNPGYITMDSKRSKLIYNQAFTLKTFLSIVKNSAEDLTLEAKQLLDLLKKEYNLTLEK